MSNIAAAFDAAGQGLGQMASMQMNREMMEAQMMRAENLAILKDALTTHRQLAVTNARGQILGDITQQRVAAEHSARDEEIGREETGRAGNQAAAQRRQLINTEQAQDNAAHNSEHLQDSAFTNRLELQGRQGRVQAARDAAVQANQARQQKAQIRTWLAKYQQQSHGTGTVQFDDAGTVGSGPLDMQQLAQRAQHDSVLRSQLQAYKDADTREQAATRAMGSFPSPYSTPSTPGAVAPPNDPLASPPTSSLIPIPSEGPGIADQPYPASSGADTYFMSSPMDDSSGSSDDTGSDGND